MTDGKDNGEKLTDIEQRFMAAWLDRWRWPGECGKSAIAAGASPWPGFRVWLNAGGTRAVSMEILAQVFAAHPVGLFGPRLGQVRSEYERIAGRDGGGTAARAGGTAQERCGLCDGSGWMSLLVIRTAHGQQVPVAPTSQAADVRRLCDSARCGGAIAMADVVAPCACTTGAGKRRASDADPARLKAFALSDGTARRAARNVAAAVLGLPQEPTPDIAPMLPDAPRISRLLARGVDSVADGKRTAPARESADDRAVREA